MTPDDVNNESVTAREVQSRMEAIAYVEAMLPDLITLATSEPLLQHLLEVALAEAKEIVRRMPDLPDVIEDPVKDPAKDPALSG